MNTESTLIVTLVDRLATRLPYRTGSSPNEFHRDEFVVLTRATLVGVSSSCISLVIETLVQLLEDFSKPYKGVQSHPIHILVSEIYVLELLADCCAKHWASVNSVRKGTPAGQESESDSSDSENVFDSSKDYPPPIDPHIRTRRASRKKTIPHLVPAEELEDDLVKRMIDAIKIFLSPVSDNYVLPASQILDDVFMWSSSENRSVSPESATSGHANGTDTSKFLLAKDEVIESCIRGIVEYVSFSNWARVLEYLKLALRAAHPAAGNTIQTSNLMDDDRGTLVSIRLISSFWVDSRKLGIIIQELCGCFLHLRKAFQTTVAIVLPLLITRWLERNPQEFIELHTMHERLDGGAETLFDMSNTMFDGGKRKSLLFPFQTSLLLLLPDVFEVASNMRDVKSSSISKKVSFLEMLRKSLRNRNEAAIYCLTSVLRVARHFSVDSDAAILSYALDVQEEVREAVFRRYTVGMDTTTIDSGLMTAAFVSLAHLSFESCGETLVPLCLSPGSPQEFKIAVISSCAYFARQSNAQEYQPLFAKVADFVRSQLKATPTNPRDSYPDEQYTLLKPLERSNSPEMIYNILLFLDASPLTFFMGAPSDGTEWKNFFQDVFTSFINYLASEDERIRYLANVVSRETMVQGCKALWRTNHSLSSVRSAGNFWKSTSLVLVTVSRVLISGTDDEKPSLSFIHDFISSRLLLLKDLRELSELDEEIPERALASTELETTFLVSLCSVDISVCQLVTRCISIFCEENKVIEDLSTTSKSLTYLLRNPEIYSQISSKDFRFTGLVAFQKRVRGLLRQLRYPTAGILNAWEIIFDKWLILSRERLTEHLDEKSLVQWRNYSGFLASLGGVCVSSRAIPLEDPALAGLRWIDRLAPDSFEDTLLVRYMKQSIQLLASDNVRIREATRESLSTELSSSLYLHLFEALEEELGHLFESNTSNATLSVESRITFAEQAASLLKSIVERLGAPTEIGAALSIDVGALTLNFARFLDDLTEGQNVLRVKIKICQLCETVTQKKELLNLRHDVRIRNQLLEIIFGWIARPGSPKADAALSAGARVEDILRLQKELDKACLKALADLTYRLPLQPAEGQTDADTSDLKSQMFHTYFNRFLSLLNYDGTEVGRGEMRLLSAGIEDSMTTPELAISALSNLLSANIDVGLKHSLGIGYHEDLDIRTAFVKVLCNILIQGTEFNNLSDTAVNEKYDELLDLLINDIALTIALCDACPSTEVDEMTISLLNIFDSRGLGFALLEALIEHEVNQTENEAELLRRNCVATKMLSIYAKWKGAAYLKATLQKVLERLILTSKDLDLELDPARTSSAEELHKNALQLRGVTKVFIDDICNSASHIPVSFRKICNIISSAVMKRFPEAKFTAVGAFIFLRFFCPAIVAPDAEGLISTAPSKEMRRGLLLIAKVVQNLANNVLFGAKEPYMFPLNDFLTQNIYRVTTFLREISTMSTIVEPTIETESFDFGSCVALHRFLYDHWDHVRQKIVLRERKNSIKILGSPLETPNTGTPILESLRKLITNLGPPPMDVSWNRPAISSNSPPSYSRFQHFMLRNAGRNTDSLVSARAVYDGGESKDGIPMICIILRNIDTETTDYELLLFGYLKIASRMWHRPFGILIDATCYNGQNEPQDALFRKLDLLTPVELSKQLSRVYVYNMNSAFRKCFRRIVRLAAKSENSAFHPKNVDYHLIGSLQDLQTHFHLSQLHLPKETISVVTDTRYVFQPITRLSKTKGKIEVVIKVGSQFVQVTTTKKQEVVQGLRLHATVNDIFRLSEVDEAPTSIQTEDDSAFGLRTDNGKIVMYFTSPRKPDVLQAIRGAKSKHGKELRSLRSFERLVRPQDVPGTLLNIALSNMASSDQVLRLASYNLLCALCRAFKFAADSKFMTIRELCIPLNPSRFIIDISQQLASAEPQLTVDFLNEFFVGWDSFPYSQRPLCLAYMAPWLPGLRTSLIPNELDSDKSKEKVAIIFRKLIEVAISGMELSMALEQCIYPTIARDEIYIDLFLDEVIKAALAFGTDDERTEILGGIISSLGTITIRGKLISRLRKALNRTSLRSTRHLPDNTVWGEICVLLRLCLSTSFDSGAQSQLFLPEIFHLATMLANTGSSNIRIMVHRLVVNTIHAMCTTFGFDEIKLGKLKGLLLSLSEPRNELLFNNHFRDASSGHETGAASLIATEALAELLSEVSVIAAVSVDMSNAWRSRWMSLVASTAFQTNPAIQPRAFTVMGCLAREDVDDDLLYQVLVALRNSIGRFMDDGDSEMLIAIVTSLTKMMVKLPSASRYGLQLFWLALSLVRLVPVGLFNCCALFLDALMTNITTSGDLKEGRMVQALLQGRHPIEDAALQLDEIYGIHFTAENFHFAICATLAKGLTESVTKSVSLRVLNTFLNTTSASLPPGRVFPQDITALPYMALLASRGMTPEEAKDAFLVADIDTSAEQGYSEDSMGMIDIRNVKDKELLLNSAISIVDFRYLEDLTQHRCLLWLNRIALIRPTVILHLCSPVIAILDDVLISCQNSATLESAHRLLRTLTSNPKFSGNVDSSEMLDDVLEGIGFGGLWRSSTFHAANEHERQCTALTDRLIELIIA